MSENIKRIESIFKRHLDTIHKLSSVINNVNEVADIIKKTLHAGGKVLIFGNGGSASDSQHIAIMGLNTSFQDKWKHCV